MNKQILKIVNSIIDLCNSLHMLKSYIIKLKTHNWINLEKI